MAKFSFLAPFSAIDAAFKLGFDTILKDGVANLMAVIAAPLLTCVTIWIVVQGILVMRGDIDPRRGLTKLIKIAFVVSLVTSANLYQETVVDMFETGLPNTVQKLTKNPLIAVPLELDGILISGQLAFELVAARIPEMDELDSNAFVAAQFAFYFSLWSIFAVYHVVGILTTVLVVLGPLFIIGFLFEATSGITTRWIGQLVSYAILLLLTSIVATVVVITIAAVMVLVIGSAATAGPLGAQLMGLYQLDMLIFTGNALVVALPGIAASLGNGVAAEGAQAAQSMYRSFAGKVSPNAMIAGSNIH